ncbi:MAG TPA: homoaconitate hydratase [Thermodesulfobacteriota bacterium]|nr:homoaconitate hydratase [Thermodesulfobacteriota bacterium]
MKRSSRIYFVDGTLREGEQSPGVYFTKEEKVQIALELDRIGVPILDAGMPSISLEEREAIAAIARQGLKASVGVSIRLKKDEVDQAFECDAKEVFIICPVSSLHIRSKLGLDEEGVKRLAGDVVRYAQKKGVLINLVAEDAARAEIPFLVDILSRAFHHGARRAFICDTVGVMEPFRMKSLVKKVRDRIPQEMELGVHCHNDLGLATANTLAAIEAGVNYPSVTVNGIGDRAGNPALHEVVLALEKIFRRQHGIDLQGLYSLSRLVEQCSGIFIPPHAPIVGLNAFRHESGIHVDGILKNSRTYKIIDSNEVGRESSFVLGKHTGTQTILHLLGKRGYEANEEELKEILHRVKKRKTAKGKAEIHRMAKEMGSYYEASLNFPLEAFWDIAKGVLKKDA